MQQGGGNTMSVDNSRFNTARVGRPIELSTGCEIQIANLDSAVVNDDLKVSWPSSRWRWR